MNIITSHPKAGKGSCSLINTHCMLYSLKIKFTWLYVKQFLLSMLLFKRLMLVLVWLVVLVMDWTAYSVTAQGKDN